jgi:threonine/homoserine/homoserine lactone efflux protein
LNWRLGHGADPFYRLCCCIALLLAIPGPTILLVISYSLSHGRQAAFATILGVMLGDITAITASMAGLGALLAVSSELFMVLKWIGALYLVWLGVKLWRSPVADTEAGEIPARQSHYSICFHCWLVTALNPKSIAFFVAFLPQFFVASEPMAPQMLILGVTFVVIAVINAVFYALLADRARARVSKPRTRRLLNRLGGSILILAGGMTAAMRRV